MNEKDSTNPCFTLAKGEECGRPELANHLSGESAELQGGKQLANQIGDSYNQSDLAT